eukprot:1191943-Prorocentrum_minimum.AAC.5
MPSGSYILTADQSDAGSAGIFSQRTNRTLCAGQWRQPWASAYLSLRPHPEGGANRKLIAIKGGRLEGSLDLDPATQVPSTGGP